MKNPSGMCQCGCGQRSPLSKWSRRGYKQGEPLLFIKGHSSRKLSPQWLEEDRGHGTPCWIWQRYIGTWGYGHVGIEGERRVRPAHIAAWVEKHGHEVPDGHELHHLCGVRACVNPDHLVAVTRREHMRLDGRAGRGHAEAEHCTREVIELRRQGLLNVEIAERLGCHHSRVTRLLCEAPNRFGLDVPPTPYWNRGKAVADAQV